MTRTCNAARTWETFLTIALVIHLKTDEPRRSVNVSFGDLFSLFAMNENLR